MKRIFLAISLLALLAILAFLCCTRENPTMPDGALSRKNSGQRIAYSSSNFWPCSTEVQIDSAFANFTSGDIIFIQKREDAYSWTTKQFRSYNKTLFLLGEDTTVVLKKTARVASQDYFFHFTDTFTTHPYCSLTIRNIKFQMPLSAACNFFRANHPRVSIQNVVAELDNGQSMSLVVDDLDIANFRIVTSAMNHENAQIRNHSDGSSFSFNIDNSTLIQINQATTNSANLEFQNNRGNGAIAIRNCYFYDQDTVFARILNTRSCSTNLTLQGNYLDNGRLTCSESGSGSLTFAISYEANHEAIGTCYEDVLGTICSNQGNCPASINLSSWINDNTLYGDGMFANIEWSKDAQAGQVTLTWNTTAACRGYAEIFSGENCETVYTTSWDSTISTSHAVTLDADLCDTYSAKIYALPNGCDSLIPEGDCHSYDPRPDIAFDDFTWSEDAEQEQVTLSWSTSESCMGFARIYSGQNCATLLTTVWDSTLSTTHSVTFDAEYCAYSSAKIYAQAMGCDSLIPEGNCHSHYFEPDVQFSNLSHSQDWLRCTLTISWNTDIACKGSVFVYSGTVCGYSYGAYYDDDISTSHSVTFNINPATDYSWKIYARFDNCSIYEGTCRYAKSGKCAIQR